ncbi:MAG: Cell shape-determining protein MreC [Gammaproteobacteria bacterium]|nr:Cell shape-determining protein MreC [Gammaproteobacteria bacterium]
MALQRVPQSSSFARFFALVLICAVIMFADTRTSILEPVRLGLGSIVTPIHFVADLPSEIGVLLDSWLESEESVKGIYDEIVDENVRLRFRLQRMQALELENRDLRHILSAPRRGDTRSLVGGLVEVSLDPYKQKILVNRGVSDGLYVGQPVFDPDGVLGQVTEAMPFTSAVMLITDPSHALPVQVTRHGLRAVAIGTGQPDRLRIVYLTPNDDIQKGDRLVTSGLGGRFPAGYPVGRVAEVVEDAGEPFLKVTARPVAQVGHNKHVLFVWHSVAALRDDEGPR